jgi:hypothetical protein
VSGARDTDASTDAGALERDAGAGLDGGPEAPRRDTGTLDGGSDAGEIAPISIPTAGADGQPLDVGLLVLGHSTSAGGDWPGKLRAGLGAAGDPRNYVVFRSITCCDGGFLWTVESARPGDVEYRRFQSSGAEQFCEDDEGTRWSCRRTQLVRGLTGREPAPAECSGAATDCNPPAIAECVWHDEDGRHTDDAVSFHDCWQRMDVRIALIQDTTNRSFPVADYDRDGDADERDYWPVSRIRGGAAACPDGDGDIGGSVDWTCDGTLDTRDAPVRVYAEWLGSLSRDLLDGFGADGVDYVFISPKPQEISGRPHASRTPTPDAPFDHDFLPSVYWESRSLELLLDDPGRDPRVGVGPENVSDMWNDTARCYVDGWSRDDWTIPDAAGRPDDVAADDGEDDGDSARAASTGCYVADHNHHNGAGGWVMADVWYRGLRHYLPK